MTWPRDPTANLDEWIEAYFADQKIVSRDVSRRLVDRQPIPKTPLPDYDGRLFDWLTYMLNYGPPDGPEQTWPILLELVARAPDEATLSFIGSHALEDLVNKAGSRFANRIAEQARRDPRFRLALCDVWYRDDVPPDLKELVDRSRAQAWT